MFRLPEDKLPTEYPLSQAVKIYLRHLWISFVVLVYSFLFLEIGLSIFTQTTIFAIKIMPDGWEVWFFPFITFVYGLVLIYIVYIGIEIAPRLTLNSGILIWGSAIQNFTINTAHNIAQSITPSKFINFVNFVWEIFVLAPAWAKLIAGSVLCLFLLLIPIIYAIALAIVLLLTLSGMIILICSFLLNLFMILLYSIVASFLSLINPMSLIKIGLKNNSEFYAP